MKPGLLFAVWRSAYAKSQIRPTVLPKNPGKHECEAAESKQQPAVSVYVNDVHTDSEE